MVINNTIKRFPLYQFLVFINNDYGLHYNATSVKVYTLNYKQLARRKFNIHRVSKHYNRKYLFSHSKLTLNPFYKKILLI
jgi:hypothetical protein